MVSMGVEEAGALRERALAGDGEARRLLGESVVSYIYQVAIRMYEARGFDSAEEALSVAMTYVLGPGIRRYDPSRGVRWVTYAGWVASREIAKGVNRRRRRLPDVPCDLAPGSCESREPDPQDDVSDRDLREYLRSRVDLVPEPRRRALVLRFGLEGAKPMTFPQLGEALGVSREWARVLVADGLDMLRDDASLGVSR